MDAQAILDRIEQDARDSASSTLDDAQKRADSLREASEARIRQQRENALSRAQADGTLMRERMLRMAELEDKKELLAAKRTVMDKAFDDALGLMEKMDAKQLRAFLLTLAAQVADGDETLLIGQRNAAWFDDSFIAQANEMLLAAGKKGALKKSAENVPGVGFALQKSGTQVNCTMDALLMQSRLTLETDVARVLFG